MRSLQVILCMAAVAVASAKPGFLHSAYSAPAAVVTGPLAVSSQYHAQDALGQYSYGYSGGPSAKAETKTADGVTRGGYSYIDSNGIVQTTNYVSDSVNGFRVAATNLPVHVSAPIHDTPEVAVAKVAHAVAYNDAAVAAATAHDVPEPEAIAAAPTFYTALPSAVTGHVYTALPSAVTGHSYTAPGIVASANGAGGFAYSTASIVPTYAPSYYTAVLPASTASTVYTAAPTVYTSAPTVVASHAYAAPGVVATANTAGGFAYSVGPTYAAHYYSAVLPSVPVLVNGVPADTPEVAAAKAAHYAAHIEEKLRHFG